MLVTDAIFYLFAFVLVFAATMVIAARNPMHSVLFLILSFFSAAGLFLLCGAEFAAMILVIVYVGAVAVLFLFVVMMLDIDGNSLRTAVSRHLPIGLAVSAIMLVQLIAVGGAWTLDPGAFHSAAGAVAAPDNQAITNTQAIGALLYTRYFYAFQIAGLILLVSMIGAIVLTLRHRPDALRQNLRNQTERKTSDVVAIRQVRAGEGVRL